MKPLCPALLLGLGLSIATITPATAYPVDCAILLCIAGGWPASAECSQARAVFIRRITPWPIEPPLQIWNCPMRVGFRKPMIMERLFEAQVEALPVWPALNAATEPPLHHISGQADLDISDPAFDFVRSIHVFEINYQQRRTHDGDCSYSLSVFAGSYGQQGEYRRKRSSLSAIPKASGLKIPSDCIGYLYRSVFVDWNDYERNYGHEEVRY